MKFESADLDSVGDNSFDSRENSSKYGEKETNKGVIIFATRGKCDASNNLA